MTRTPGLMETEFAIDEPLTVAEQAYVQHYIVYESMRRLIEADEMEAAETQIAAFCIQVSEALMDRISAELRALHASGVEQPDRDVIADGALLSALAALVGRYGRTFGDIRSAVAGAQKGVDGFYEATVVPAGKCRPLAELRAMKPLDSAIGIQNESARKATKVRKARGR